MNRKIYSIVAIAISILFMTLSSCLSDKKRQAKIDTDKYLSYCNEQVKKTLLEIQNDSCKLPRNIDSNAQKWNLIDAYDWTSGFWPGTLWYNYEYTKDKFMKDKAIQYTECLIPLLNTEHKGDHDLGFQFFCSFGNAYRITGDEKYKKIILRGADKLAGFYNKKVGTILSWSHMVDQMGWPHNTIMDNMMNLEILFWAAKNGGNPEYYAMAESHARKTMQYQFRDDYTNYHVAIYDTINGNFIKGVTNQGYSDDSFWARGQAWAIYGYTMVYRETGNKEFLRFAEKITDVYLKRLPEGYVPYWDFDDPQIPNAPRDASAAAIVASALLELSVLDDDRKKSDEYFYIAEKMLSNLSSNAYLSGESKSSFLLHSTGNYPAKYEIDASINYADYYYIEALNRYRKITSRDEDKK